MERKCMADLKCWVSRLIWWQSAKLRRLRRASFTFRNASPEVLIQEAGRDFRMRFKPNERDPSDVTRRFVDG